MSNPMTTLKPLPLPTRPARTPMEILCRAERYMRNPERVVKDGTHAAEDADGEWSCSDGPAACRVCLIGAFVRAAIGSDDEIWAQAHLAFCAAGDNLNVKFGELTDSKTGKRVTHSRIMKVWKEAKRIVKEAKI